MDTTAATLTSAPEVLAAFVEARFTLVGFTPQEEEALAPVFQQMGGLSRFFPANVDPLAPAIASSAAVILNLTPDLVQTGWIDAQQLHDLKPPLVAVGSHDVLVTMGVVQSMAGEVLTRPFTNEELVFRAWRCIARASRRTLSSGAVLRKTRILIADDDRAMVGLATGILSSQAFECHEARDGWQALDLARMLLPDLLILDVNMPLMKGFDVLKTLRDDPSTSTLKVLMFTAAGRHEEVVRGISLGANGYLCKPFRPFDFIRRVREVLAHAPGVPGEANTEPVR
jgi:CheY-like chemotaxis protein